MRTAAADLAVSRGERPRVLVTITAPGITLRLAEEDLAISDGDTGQVYHYLQGLLGGVDVLDEVDAFQGTSVSGLQSVRLRIALAGLDVADEEDAHLGLMAAAVEVALWWDGAAWAQRQPILQAGRVSKLAPGIGEEPTELWVDSAGPPAGRSWVEADRDIGADFPSLGFTSLDGKLWPAIVGVVHYAPAFKLGIQSVSYLDLGLCGHPLAPDVVIGDLDFYEDGASASPSSPSLASGTDSTGPYAYVRVSDTGAPVDAFDLGTGAYTVSYTTGAAACARDGGRAARSAGDVLEWLLHYSGERIDWTAQAACTRMLADLTIGIIRDQVVGELEVIRQRLLPLLPIVERRTRDGLYFAWVEPATLDPVARLTFGQELVDRLGPPSYTDLDAVRNEVTVEYDWSGYTGTYLSRVVVGAADLEACRYSQQLWGVQTADTIRCDLTWDANTARRLGAFAMQRRALPRLRSGYVLHPSMYWLEAGSVVLVTDPDLGLSERRAVVRRMHPTLSPPTIELEALVPPPVGRL